MPASEAAVTSISVAGAASRHIRMVYCRTCKKSYSERKGTALERSQLPTDNAVSVLDHLREGCGSAPPAA